jgi:hypothetical protein
VVWKPKLPADAGRVLGIVADVLGVLTVVITTVQLLTDKSPAQTLLALILASIALTFLALAFRLERQLASVNAQYARHARTVGALPQLANAMGHMGRAVLSLRTSVHGFLPNADAACQELGTYFTAATGHSCRVTVKEAFNQGAPGNGGPGTAVRTICSSEPVHGGRRGTATIDLVDENTDFYELSKPPAPRVYLCNDLPREIGRGYRNSHWSTEQIRLWTENGDFPYKSTLVWPIKGRDESDPAAPDIIAGFLCVDSRVVGTFDREFDVSPGETFAHALYLGLTAYRTETQRQPA